MWLSMAWNLQFFYLRLSSTGIKDIHQQASLWYILDKGAKTVL